MDVKTLLASACTASALALGATAVDANEQTGASRKDVATADKMKQVFWEMDGNEDGMVSKTEYSNAVDERFSKLDENGNDSLTQEEMRSAPWAFQSVEDEQPRGM